MKEVDRLQEGRREVKQYQGFSRLGLNASPPPPARPRSSILRSMGASTRLCLLFLALAGAASCAGDDRNPGDDSASDDMPEDATAELGTGTTEFEPLADESELVLVAGPQGGFHFVVHARMRGLDPGDPARPGLVENPRTEFAVTDEVDQRLDVEMAPYRLGYLAIGDDYVLPSGRIVRIRNEAVPSLYGRRARIEVQVTDASGESASDGRWIVVVEAPPR